MWQREDLAWVAGILEGEGCFINAEQRGRLYPRVIVEMTDEDVVQRANYCSRCHGRRVLRESDGRLVCRPCDAAKTAAYRTRKAG